MKRHSFVHNIKHAACVSIAVCMAVYLSTISAAASTTSGSKWGSPTQKISASAISGTFETAMGNAVFEINQQTDVIFRGLTAHHHLGKPMPLTMGQQVGKVSHNGTSFSEVLEVQVQN